MFSLFTLALTLALTLVVGVVQLYRVRKGTTLFKALIKKGERRQSQFAMVKPVSTPKVGDESNTVFGLLPKTIDNQ